MATPAAVLSVLVNTDSASATAKLTEYNAKLEKTAEMARKPIEARLGATFDPAGFDAYEAKVAQIERKNADRQAFRTELGANYSPQGFNAYQRAVVQAEKSQTSISDKVQATGKSLSSVGKSLSTYVTLPIVGIGVVAGKMSTNFQASMERLKTQAGASQAQVQQLSKAVLGLAGSVGTGPEELAAGMYHVTSSLNATLPAAKRVVDEMKVLKIAAEGAKVGGADLVDVTNALDAAVVSGIKGISNYRQGMGALNSVVGAGDMTMQNLADALGTGLLAPMKKYGLTLNEVGGALATFGDNNIRGADAATKLSSAIRIMAAPSDAAAKELASIGLGPTKLANDLRKPNGLITALTDLKAHLNAAGLTASQQNRVFTLAFGGRQAQGVQVLSSQLDRLKSKTAEVTDGANKFGAAWKKTQETSSFKMQAGLASIEASLVKIGNAILPVVVPLFQKVAAAVQTVAGWFSKLSPSVRTAIIVFAGILAVLGPVAVVLGVIIAVGPEIIAAVVGIAAVAAILIAKWKTVKPFFEKLWNDIKIVVANGVNVVKTILHGLEAGFHALVNTIRGVVQVIKGIVEVFVGVFTLKFSKMWAGVKNIFHGGIKAILGILTSAVIQFETAGKAIGAAFGSGLKAPLVDVLDWIIGAVNYVIKQINSLDAVKIFGHRIGAPAIPSISKVSKATSTTEGGAVHARPGSQLAHDLAVGSGTGVTARPGSPLARALQRGRDAEHAKTAGTRAHARTAPDDAAGRHAARVRTVTEPTRRVRQRASVAATGPLLGAAPHVSTVAGADRAINSVDAKILKLEQARQAATTKAQKSGLDNELAVARLRRSGLELQRTQLEESASAHTKQQASDQKAAAARQKAAQAALSQWLAYWSHIPSQAAGQQIKLAKLQNRITVAQNDNNTGGQSKGLHGEEKLYKQWLQADETKLRKLNQQLGKPNLPGKQHRALVNDKLALIQEIGTIQGDIGQTSSSLTSLAGSSTGTDSTGGSSGFDLAPTGASIPFPTAVDVNKAIRTAGPGAVHHHHNQRTNIVVHVKHSGDVHKVTDAIDKATGGHLHAKMRAAGMRGT